MRKMPAGDRTCCFVFVKPQEQSSSKDQVSSPALRIKEQKIQRHKSSKYFRTFQALGATDIGVEVTELSTNKQHSLSRRLARARACSLFVYEQ
jgi:hypothetical protein